MAQAGYPVGIAAIVTAVWSLGWHDGPGADDFPGHTALLFGLKQQLASDGPLPLWTPDWYAGASLVMTYLHPLFSLAVLAPFTLWFGNELGLRIGDTVFLALAGVAMYAWCKSYGGSRRGAALGALIYALHPSVFVFVGASGQVHQPVSMAIVPVVFLAWQRLAVKPDARHVVLTAVVSALLFYDMQRFWMIFPFAAALYFASALSVSNHSPLRSISAAAAVGIAMAGLLCFPVVPGLIEAELLRWHQPESIDLYRERHSLPALFSLVDRDGVLTSLRAADSVRFAALPGQWYQGLVALLFVATGAVAAMRNPADRVRRSRIAAALGLWIAALSLAFGVHAVGSGGVFAPAVIAISSGLVALFACVAFAAIRSAAIDRWPNRRAIVNVALALAVIAFLLVAPFPILARVGFIYERMRAPAHFAFPMLAFALGTAVAVVTPSWERWFAGRIVRMGFTVAFVALLALDVWPYLSHLQRSDSREVVEEGRRAFRSLRERPPGRLLDTRQYNPLANRFGVIEAERRLGWGWLGWSSSRYASELVADGFYASLQQAVRDPQTRARSMQTAAGLAAAAHVRFVSRIVPLGPELPDSSHFTPVWGGEQIELHENALVLPFVQFYPELAVVSGSAQEVLPVVARLSVRGVVSLTLPGSVAETLPADLQPAFWFGARARELVLEPTRPAVDVLERAERDPLGRKQELSPPCATLARDTGRIRLACIAASDGYLVIAESWSPRWQVEIDGQSRPLLRLNHAFLGAQLKKGAHRVEFRYRQSGAMAVSLWVSAFSWAGVLAFAIRTAVVIRRSRVL